IKQAYISIDPVLRIRQKDDTYFFTFKGKGFLKRTEFEQEITKNEFENLLKKIEGNIIEKTRYIYPLKNGLFAEIDVFEKPFKDIYIVEVEFNSLEDAQKFTPPDWFGQDITNDAKFTNAYLSKFVMFHKF
ncbi:MAG: CYTH domain-containing protein, partial [Eubacteriales bacterium]|nr:CYTH domain-containing protein [Eubacteriales bacterium]